MTDSNERFDSIDAISGCMIIYMIVYHVFQWCNLCSYNDTIVMHLLSFFMFWFFFKSGMFYKAKCNKELIYGGAKKLLVPFLIFSLFGHILNCIHLFLVSDRNWMHYILSPIKSILVEGSLEGNYPLWFLPSLFFCQLFCNVMIKNKVKELYIIILMLFLAYCCYYWGFTYPLYISNISLGIVFYLLGYKLKSIQYRKNVYFFSVALYLFIFCFRYSAIDVRTNLLNSNGIYWCAILYALAGCVVIDNLFCIQKFHLKWLTYIGRNSMIFYVLHWMILILCSFFLPESGKYNFGIMLFSCFIIIPLFYRLVRYYKLEWIFGMKKKY